MAITGRCHCGRNSFEIDGELPEALTRCTCSICSKRGHLYAYYRPDQVKVTQADSDAIAGAPRRWRTISAALAVATSTPTVRPSNATARGTARPGASPSMRA